MNIRAPGRQHSAFPPLASFRPSRWFALALALVGLLSRSVPAQAPTAAPEAQTAFDAAARAFQDGLYERAEKEFAEFALKNPEAPRAPEAVLFQARAALQQQKLTLAIDLLTNHLAKASSWADQYRYWLADAQARSGNNQAAADLLAQLIKDFPASPRLLEASYGEAKARFELRDWPKVVELLQKPDGTFQKEVKNRPTDELVARGFLLLSEVLLEMKNYRGAEQTLQALPEQSLTPKYQWQRQLLLVRIAMAEQQYEKALASTTNLLTRATASGIRDLQAESIALRGALFEQLNQPEAALQTYTNNLAESFAPERRRHALIRIIRLTLLQNKLGEASDRLEMFLAQNPAHAASDDALLALGELRLRQFYLAAENQRTHPAAAIDPAFTNGLPEALGYFTQLLTNFPQSPLVGRAQLQVGWCAWEQGKLAESLAAFKAAAEKLPASEDQAVARLKLGDVQYRQNDLTNALQTYRALLQDYAPSPRARETLLGQAHHQVVRVSLDLHDLAAASEAQRKFLEEFPTNALAERSLIGVGQRLVQAGKTAEGRALLQEFARRFPTSTNLAEVELALAQSFVQERDWAGAERQYGKWMQQFPTNAVAPEVAFSQAWASYQAGQATNALALFTRFLERYPLHPRAPLAHQWLADAHFRQGDYVSAEKSYQLLFQNTNWPPSLLTYRARMMAGRAATARQDYNGAKAYFESLLDDKSCPPEVLAEAYFALGDTYTWLASPSGRPEDKFKDAVAAFAKIPQLYPTDRLAPLAWGRLGDCYRQWSELDPKYLEQATNAYDKVLAPTNRADVAARSQAEVGLGQVLERLAEPKTEPDKTGVLKAALDRYLNVFYGKNLGPSEKADPFWTKEAGLHAARLAENQQQWDVAINIYHRLAALLPSLQATMEKRIDRARAQLQARKT